VGWILAFVPACFHPVFERVTCGPNDECPGDLACSNQHVCGGEDVDAAPVDAPIVQFGTFIKVMFSSPADVTALTAITLAGTIDTDASTMCNMHNDQSVSYCVVAGTNIMLANGTTFSAHGTKPLVLLSTATFDLQGTLDVSSKQGIAAGAGAAVSCSGAIAATGNSGGFGGSFGGAGGNGGAVDGGPVTAAPVVPGFPQKLTGGCPGVQAARRPRSSSPVQVVAAVVPSQSSRRRSSSMARSMPREEPDKVARSRRAARAVVAPAA
jgi:hypothetical protein